MAFQSESNWIRSIKYSHGLSNSSILRRARWCTNLWTTILLITWEKSFKVHLKLLLLIQKTRKQAFDYLYFEHRLVRNLCLVSKSINPSTNFEEHRKPSNALSHFSSLFVTCHCQQDYTMLGAQNKWPIWSSVGMRLQLQSINVWCHLKPHFTWS